MNSSDSFRPALARLQEDCPEVLGAVLATSEGLILAASGELASDAAAASAVHLIEQVDRCLGLLCGEGCEAMLIWAETELWCLARLGARSALRLAVQQAGRQLEPELAHLAVGSDCNGRRETGGSEHEPGPDPAYYASA